MSKINVSCDTGAGVMMLFEEFQKLRMDDIDRVRTKERKILMKNGDVITIYDSSDRLSTLGLTDLIPERDFRKDFGLETGERHDSIHNTIGKQFKGDSDF